MKKVQSWPKGLATLPCFALFLCRNCIFHLLKIQQVAEERSSLRPPLMNNVEVLKMKMFLNMGLTSYTQHCPGGEGFEKNAVFYCLMTKCSKRFRQDCRWPISDWPVWLGKMANNYFSFPFNLLDIFLLLCNVLGPFRV